MRHKKNEESSGRERRRAKRYRVEIPVKIYLKNNPNEEIVGEITNLSASGAFVSCPVSIPKGDEILIELGTGGLKLLPGIVTNTEGQPHLPPGIPHTAVIRWADKEAGFGVEFVNLDAERRKELLSLIEYIERHG
jgi:hypothetical protein